MGRIPIAAFIKGIHLEECLDFEKFAADLQNPYPSKYTFIEPNYGNIINNTFEGGSSQHPKDGVHGGELLIKRTYEAIRNSPLWEKSLLIVTYDEHGGFYDSVTPPKTVSPGDDYRYSVHNFDFTQLGLRVPAVVVSPYIKKGTVDHTQYEHSSVPATIGRAFELKALTKRDAAANDVLRLLSLKKPRTDCVATLKDPVPDLNYGKQPSALTAEEENASIGTYGNNIGFLYILLKSDLRLAIDDDEKKSILSEFNSIKTKGQALQYLKKVLAKVEDAKKNL